MSALREEWDSIDAPQSKSKSLVAKPTASAVRSEWDAIDTKSVTEKQAERPSPLGSDTENFFAGVGKGATDVGRGAKQLLDIPAVWLEKRFPGIAKWSEAHGIVTAEQGAAQTQKNVNDARELEKPLMQTWAGGGGAVAGNIAATMVPLGLAAKGASIAGDAALARTASTLLNPTTYAAAAGAGAAQGALQPVADGESRLHNVAWGAGAGMAGNAIANTIGRLAQPVQAIASAAHDKAVGVLEKAGIPLDAAQKSGSTFLNKLRSSFSDNPFTAGAQRELIDTQKNGFNRAVLKTIGEEADAATPEVMGAAEKRINGVFKDVLDRNNITISDSTLSRIGDIQRAANEEEKKQIGSIANRLIGAVDKEGSVPGQLAYGIKKDLDRLASSSDTTLAYHAKQLRSTVMDSIHSSLDGADKKSFAEARGQFANMKKIESTIDRMGNGDISASKLANVFNQKANRAISVYGKGPRDLHDLAQSGNMLLPDHNPNSGTMARAAMQIAAPLAIGGAEGAYTGDWEAAAKTAGALYAVPKAAQYLINSPASAAYLSQGMRGPMTPIRDLLLLPQTNAAVGGVVRRLPNEAQQKR